MKQEISIQKKSLRISFFWIVTKIGFNLHKHNIYSLLYQIFDIKSKIFFFISKFCFLFHHLYFGTIL